MNAGSARSRWLAGKRDAEREVERRRQRDQPDAPGQRQREAEAEIDDGDGDRLARRPPASGGGSASGAGGSGRRSRSRARHPGLRSESRSRSSAAQVAWAGPASAFEARARSRRRARCPRPDRTVKLALASTPRTAIFFLQCKRPRGRIAAASQRGSGLCTIISTNSTTPPWARSGPPPTRRGSTSRTRSTRSRIRPSGGTSPRPPNCSSARPAVTASPSSASRRPRCTASACRSPSAIVWERPFCRLHPFREDGAARNARPQPKLLIVAPMSGHYATLLRGTVETMLLDHDVYITDWTDARMVPLATAASTSTTTSTTSSRCCHFIGEGAHVMAVCQPSVPVLAAAAIMEARGDPPHPGDDDADGRADRHAPQPDRRQHARQYPRPRLVPAERDHAGALPASGLHARGLSRLPPDLRLPRHEHRPPHRGASRPVPSSRRRRRRLGREAPRLLRRVSGGDGPHRRVLPADRRHRLHPPCPAEGRDDASRRAGRSRRDPDASRSSPSRARTTTSPASARPKAAHDICTGIPADRRAHYLQPKVGHYGVFNGSRFRAEIAPRIRDFISTFAQARASARPTATARRRQLARRHPVEGELASPQQAVRSTPTAARKSRAVEARAKPDDFRAVAALAGDGCQPAAPAGSLSDFS